MHTRLLIFFLFAVLVGQAQQQFLLVGTYTGTGSKGIYVYRFDAKTGAMQLASHTDSAENPSFLAVAPNQKFVYAVNETGGEQPGTVSAFSFDAATGALTFLNRQPTGGDHPCYISSSSDGRWVVVGNYSGGNISAFRTNTDGSLQPYAQLVQHNGSSVNKNRQEKAHVHATVFSPDGKFLLSPDLGMDKLMLYRFTGTADQPLLPAKPPFAKTKPGSGPRHVTFHPNGRYAYLIEELTGTVSVFRYGNGVLTPLQRLSSHAKNYTGVRGSADIHVSPDGKFVYASNRGDANNLAIFATDANSGKLKPIGFHPTGGNIPRNFTIDASGKFLLAANQQTDNVVLFRRNKQTGKLQSTGVELKVPRPVCLVWLQPKNEATTAR